MKKILFSALCVASIGQASGQETYLCVPSKVTGFAFNEGTRSWEQTAFRTGDTKKILRRVNGKWTWHPLGEKRSPLDCGEDFDGPGDFNSAGFIFCDVFAGHMRMNKNSLRYVETFEIGFIDGKDVNGGGPSIEIGMCSPL